MQQGNRQARQHVASIPSPFFRHAGAEWARNTGVLSAQSTRPVVNCSKAAELAACLWGLTVSQVVELVSYDDRNFRVTAEGSHRAGSQDFVLKVHNSRDGKDFIQAQDEVARFLAPHLPVASPIAALDGSYICLECLPVGYTGTSAMHTVRMSQFLAGCQLDKATQSPQLWAAVGAAFGEMDARLAAFQHPAADRTHNWDLRISADTVRRHKDDQPSERRRLLDGVLAQYAAEVEPSIPRLPCQVIHADGNESNILVDGQPGAAPCVTGILDFGDFGHNWRVAEPAILLLYVLLLAEHPVAAAVATLKGYLTRQPLTAVEGRVLFPLIQCRLAQSLVLGAASARKDPANAEYLLSTQKPGWQALQSWAGPAGDELRGKLEAAHIEQLCAANGML